MDKNAIKSYAVWARRELIEKVSQKAMQYGIEDGKNYDINLDSINGNLLSEDEKKQRRALIEKINKDGYSQVMEEVAYTWFNRFIALRFMEVNGYLPSHVRVFTDENNKFMPQLLSEALHLEFKSLDKNKVLELKQENQDDDLFKYLLIVQCNELSDILPRMFERISDYTELLLPDYLLRNGSIIDQLITLIPEEDWGDQVQILGWLYQYYNSEPKAEVDLEVKNGGKVSKYTMPAKTQIFTPDWIVRYMVENSLGNYCRSKSNLINDENWKYYIRSEQISSNEDLKLEGIRCIDPCMGSGHILCYLFELLMQVYEYHGYSPREAVSCIVKNNIWGLDVDDRAAQLAYFAVMMKARKYDRRFFSSGIQPHVYSLKESKVIDQSSIDFFSDDNGDIKTNINMVVDALKDAKTLGSIIDLSGVDFEMLKKRMSDIELGQEQNVFSIMAVEQIKPIIEEAEALTQKYEVVVTNPPYLSLGDMPEKLADTVKDKYPDSKWDMFGVFIERARELTKDGGYYALITQPSVITLGSFEKLRRKINADQSMQSLIHMGRGIFGVDFGSTAFVVKNQRDENCKANFYRLHEKTFQFIDPDDIEKIFRKALCCPSVKCDFSQYDTKTGISEKMFSDSAGRILSFALCPKVFNDVPGAPWIYEATDELLNAFKGNTLKDLATPKVGLQTGDNNRFTRLWFEVPFNEIAFNINSRQEAIQSQAKWFPYNKGGNYRKWYGNNDYIVNWENDGNEIRNFTNDKGKLKSRPQNMDYYFKECVSWSKISAGSISFRYKQPGFIFDVAGTSFFADEKLRNYLAGFCNSSVALKIAKMISPTMNYEVGHIAAFPIIIKQDKIDEVSRLVEECIDITKDDWDSYEKSWDFKKHPLIPDDGKECLIIDKFDSWKAVTESRFNRLKELEISISRIFEDIYSMDGDEAALQDDAISIRKIDYESTIKSLISYSVGCMFGRYSLDFDGITYAGGRWNSDAYKSFNPDEDNIIPICDDEYFSDDIVARFVSFISIVYGEKNLEQNLEYIAGALGENGTPRERIRSYFLNNFYNDHCVACSVSISGKRPYYWLFDSGKKNGFKCLIYMHRYQPDTIARIRTDYIHEQQARYRTAIEEITNRIESASRSDKVKLTKKLNTLKSQNDEIHAYEEEIHHLADQMISIDLDDGVKVNYAKFKDVLAKIK